MGLNVPIKLPLIKKLKEAPARRIFYSKAEIDLVLSLANDFEWLLIRLSFDTGFRLSELGNLRLKNLSGRMVKFIGKGSKPREVYLSQEASRRLQAWISEHGIEDFIWVKTGGKRYRSDELRQHMRQAFYRTASELENQAELSSELSVEKRALIRKYHDFYPHALRHSFGSDIQRNGYSLLEIQQMMGHSNAEITQRYLHGLDGKLEDLFMRLEEKCAQSRKELEL